MSEKNIKEKGQSDTKQRPVHLSDEDWDELLQEARDQGHNSRSLVIRKLVKTLKKQRQSREEE